MYPHVMLIDLMALMLLSDGPTTGRMVPRRKRRITVYGNGCLERGLGHDLTDDLPARWSQKNARQKQGHRMVIGFYSLWLVIVLTCELKKNCQNERSFFKDPFNKYLHRHPETLLLV